MAATCLHSKLASRAGLENKLTQLPAQKLAAGRMLRDRQLSAPHDGAEPLDQPRFPDDQAIALRRAGERAIAADEADAHVRRCLRQQLGSGVAKATLIKDQDVEACEVRCDERELLAQRRLRQAYCSRDGESVRCDVEEHERAVVAPAGKLETGDELQIGGRHVAPRSRGPKMDFACACGNRGNLRVPPAARNLFCCLLCTPRSRRSENRFGQSRSDFTGLLREPQEPQSGSRSSEFLLLVCRTSSSLAHEDRLRRASDLFQIPPAAWRRGECR